MPHSMRSSTSTSLSSPDVRTRTASASTACLLLEYGLAASATAIGWSDYLNNFLQNAFGWQIPPELRSPMFVSDHNNVHFNPGHFNLPPVLLVIMCCILLIRGTKESATTFRVFAIWMAVAVATYFLYSVRHSRLNKAQ